MNNLPSAKASPRIVNGVLYWYAGDTFNLDLHLDIKDQDGEPYALTEDDVFTITFENARHLTVATYTFSNIENDTINLDINAEETQKFPKGEYTYKAKLDWQQRTTIISENKVVVE